MWRKSFWPLVGELLPFFLGERVVHVLDVKSDLKKNLKNVGKLIKFDPLSSRICQTMLIYHMSHYANRMPTYLS
jgi:hypothetical protein